jgi:hypothetical protein
LNQSGENETPMRHQNLRVLLVALCATVLSLTVNPALAQSGDGKAAPGASEAGKNLQRKSDEIADAGRMVPGPGGNPECVWLGRRVVSLLWRDDLDTAFRHLDLYDRFGCPSPHIQQAFRCVVRQGTIDPKVPDALNARVHACWLSPSSPAQPAAASVAPTGSASTTR